MNKVYFSLESLSLEEREKLRRCGLKWKIFILQGNSAGYLHFSTTAGLCAMNADFSGSYFTTSDSENFTRAEAKFNLELPPSSTAEWLNRGILFDGALIAEGETLQSKTKQFYVIAGSGAYTTNHRVTP